MSDLIGQIKDTWVSMLRKWPLGYMKDDTIQARYDSFAYKEVFGRYILGQISREEANDLLDFMLEAINNAYDAQIAKDIAEYERITGKELY